MSFIGGGGAKLNTQKYTVTNTDLINAIVLSISGARFANVLLESSVGWNGAVTLQTKRQDATWHGTAIIISNPNDRVISIMGELQGIIEDNTDKYPLEFRFHIDVACTGGTMNITVDYL